MLQVKLMEVRVCFFCITTVCIEFNTCSSLHKCVFMHGHWKTQNRYQTHMQGCIYSHVWGHKLTVSATLCVCVMFCYSYCLIKVMWIEGLTCSELFIPAAAWHLHWPRVWKRIHPPNTHTQTFMYACTHKVQHHTAVQNYTAGAAINIYTSPASYLFHPAELISEGQRDGEDIQRQREEREEEKRGEEEVRSGVMKEEETES